MRNPIKQLWDRLIPSKPRSTGFREEDNSFVNTISVDTVHSIFSEAQQGQTDRLFALYRDLLITDGHSQAEFTKRKLAVLGDRMSVQAFDESSPDDEMARDAIKVMVGDCGNFIKSCSHALDSALYPVAVLEKIFEPGGPNRYRLKELVPVPHALLDYRSRELRIYDVDPSTGRRLLTSHLPDPSRYIVHRGHLLTSPDYWGGPMRALVFWWLFSMLGRDWFSRHMERYGSPFLLGHYNPDNERDRGLLESAFSKATRLFGLLIPDQTKVEILKATSSGGAEYISYLTICQREKSKIIIGQTISSEAQPTGLNSGVADLQSEVRDDFRQFDGLMLGETLREQLFEQYLSINGIPGRPPRAIWGSESFESAKVIAEMLDSLKAAGFQPVEKDLATISARVGFGIERTTADAVRMLGLTAVEAQRALGLSSDTSDAPAISPAGLRAIASSLACDRVVLNGAPDLAQAFATEDREISRIIRESKDPEACLVALSAHLAKYRPGRAAELLEAGMLAFSRNGLSR